MAQKELHESELKQALLMKKITEIKEFNQSNIEQYDTVKQELQKAKALRDEVW